VNVRELETARLRLRPLTAGDRDRLYDIYAEPDMSRNLITPPALHRPAHRSALEPDGFRLPVSLHQLAGRIGAGRGRSVAIDRLKELRTALISAAVTGKIDVRGQAA
jgi:hypothetical protein